ncbi:hypothetical protein DT23_18560 [Thioclava indica]|uniref:Uncharacterized protein n=1 Tax=Thioclava indica TaxID=1353528 RepID=A0A074JBW7_9RHOB|nr:hypothetical protein DT23_18560 [Thioclava indica]
MWLKWGGALATFACSPVFFRNVVNFADSEHRFHAKRTICALF